MGVRVPGMKNGLFLYVPLSQAPSDDIMSVSTPMALAIGVARTLFSAELVLTAMSSRPNELSMDGVLPSRQL